MTQLVKSVYKNPGFDAMHFIKTGVVINTYNHSIQENQKFKDILGYREFKASLGYIKLSQT